MVLLRFEVGMPWSRELFSSLLFGTARSRICQQWQIPCDSFRCRSVLCSVHCPSYVYHTPPSPIKISYKNCCVCAVITSADLSRHNSNIILYTEVDTMRSSSQYLFYSTARMLHYLGILFGWYATGICLYKHNLCNIAYDCLTIVEEIQTASTCPLVRTGLLT